MTKCSMFVNMQLDFWTILTFQTSDFQPLGSSTMVCSDNILHVQLKDLKNIIVFYTIL